MNYKLLKLNIKISLMKVFKTFKNNNKILNFTSDRITNPNILVIFPIEEEFISESIDCMSEVISNYRNTDSKFSFIINRNFFDKVNLFEIQIIPLKLNRRKRFINSADILDNLKLENFDIILNLNVNSNLELDMLVKKVEANYKISFVSKYSDLFYNIQLNWDESDTRFRPLISILG